MTMARRETAVPAGGVHRPIPRQLKPTPLYVWLTVEDMAAMMNVSKMTIYRLVEGREISSVRVGRSIRIREDWAQKFIAENYSPAV